MKWSKTVSGAMPFLFFSLYLLEIKLRVFGLQPLSLLVIFLISLIPHFINWVISRANLVLIPLYRYMISINVKLLTILVFFVYFRLKEPERMEPIGLFVFQTLFGYLLITAIEVWVVQKEALNEK